MAAPSLSRDELSALVRQVQGSQLRNKQLSHICQVNGLKGTGVKADLQKRITTLIQDNYNFNNTPRLLQIRQSIMSAISQAGGTSKAMPARAAASSAAYPSMPSPGISPPFNLKNGHNGAASNGAGSFSKTFHPGGSTISNGHRAGSSYKANASHLAFKTSPFYSVETRIGEVRECEMMTSHRNSLQVTINVGETPALSKCVTDKSYRVMIFCAAEPYGVQDIAFPHQSELRVNGGEIKANLRGLKNKPGSTRPVDITSALRLKYAYPNNMEFTYALTTKKFYLAIHLCRVNSVPELVSIISTTNNRISKTLVVSELNKKAQDPDVVATSQVLSLKCPLSYMRLQAPCRSISCTHIQCFDATSYLQLQEQGPQWLCPICNKPAPFDQLAIDEYAQDILDNTSESCDNVTIEPNGKWSTKSPGDARVGNSSYSRSSVAAGDDDDDDIEISEISVVDDRRYDTPQHHTPSTSTPASAGRASSALGPRGLGSISAKRPAPEVIDLTLSSDDDDDEPIQRHAKRQNTGISTWHQDEPDDDASDFLSAPAPRYYL